MALCVVGLSPIVTAILVMVIIPLLLRFVEKGFRGRGATGFFLLILLLQRLRRSRAEGAYLHLFVVGLSPIFTAILVMVIILLLLRPVE